MYDKDQPQAVVLAAMLRNVADGLERFFQSPECAGRKDADVVRMVTANVREQARGLAELLESDPQYPSAIGVS